MRMKKKVLFGVAGILAGITAVETCKELVGIAKMLKDIHKFGSEQRCVHFVKEEKDGHQELY